MIRRRRMRECLRISREPQPDDVAKALELGLKSSLVGIEGKVGNEHSVRLRGLLVTVGLGPVLARCRLWAGSRVVNVEIAAVKLSAILGFKSGLSGGSILVLDVPESLENVRNMSVREEKSGTYPLDLPVARSVTIRTAEISPKDSNSLLSQSSSMFHDREPMKRFFGFSSSTTVLAFFAEGTVSVSALRFLESDASDSEPEPDSESESDPDSEAAAAFLSLGFSSDSESDEPESESESESESEDWERKTLG